MENKIVKWEEGEYRNNKDILLDFDKPFDANNLYSKASVGDIITKSMRYRREFFVTDIQGEDIFGYYLNNENGESLR